MSQVKNKSKLALQKKKKKEEAVRVYFSAQCYVRLPTLITHSL